MHKPELVMPGGDLEKLKTSILFGGDAVYIGGPAYSLRAYASNLGLTDMEEGLAFAHLHGKKVYLTINIIAHNRDIQNLPAYFESIAPLPMDGFIISDPGIMRLAAQYAPSIPITVSTQANVTNYAAAAFYADLGVKRIVVSREMSLEEICEIKQETDVEVEVFIHGAMCVSYSGRCLLSYFMTGRSANQGACAHPCRYQYRLVEEKRPGQYFPIEEDERGSYILNSRDLCLLDYIPDLIQAGVDAFKVEGRMKSPLYAASVASVYRSAIDEYLTKGRAYNLEQLAVWRCELEGTASRLFTGGFIAGPDPELQEIHKQNRAVFEFCGIVKAYHKQTGLLEVEQRANFGPGDPLELLIPGHPTPCPVIIENLYDHEGNLLDRARHAKHRVFFPWPSAIPDFSILRRVNRL